MKRYVLGKYDRLQSNIIENISQNISFHFHLVIFQNIFILFTIKLFLLFIRESYIFLLDV
jgi:hypothetical protein